MKKILVTGGAGFLGSHLCKNLLLQNNIVICLDNLYTGKKKNLNDILSNKNFKFIHHDINEYYETDVDEIYNLACPASPIHYQSDPVGTIRTCVNGTINVLELAKKTNARILQASTSEVYGDPLIQPQSEQYWGNVNPVGIRSCYDEGKRCAETIFCDYARQFDIYIKIVRIFNTYGPNMYIEDGRVISNFIVQALKNDPITIYGDGQQSRCFCYVDDLIEGMIKMMNSKKEFIGPVNIGSQDVMTIADLASKIINITKSKSKLVYKNLPIDDPKSRKPDLGLAVKNLNWQPTTSIDNGIHKTVEYFKQILS